MPFSQTAAALRALVLACATIAALPASAQDERPEYQLLEGIEACLLGGGDVVATTATLTGYGWTAEVNEEAGLVNFAPGIGSDTIVFMSKDIGFCHLESMTMDSYGADSMLELYILSRDHGVTVTGKGVDEQGCPTQTLSNGVTVTITSGGQDPVCAGTDNSAIRFEYKAM